jgi:hypothetical protein
VSKRCPCGLDAPHHHQTATAPNGEPMSVIVYHTDLHPRAEVRDSDTGEVIFPAVKGPLGVIEGAAALTNPNPSPASDGDQG